jgi:hypothetical protein
MYVFRDNHGYGKVISLQMGKKSTFSRDLPEKSTRCHTDFNFGIEPPTRVETLCKIKKILKIRIWRYPPMSESRFLTKKFEVMFKKDDEDKL